MDQNVLKPQFSLGIDLGSASLGWSLIELDTSGNPIGLLSKQRNGQLIPACGVRIFEPGVEGTALDIEQGKDQSKAVARRAARLHRRQFRRRAYRQARLFRLLQNHELMPRCTSGKVTHPPEERNTILTELDKQLCDRYRQLNGSSDFAQLPLYYLRKTALDRKLEPYELGRVLYHLSQRRGFKSNRKEGSKGTDQKKEAGAVKAGIAELEAKMHAANARTLGEYFAGMDPHQMGQNVRRRWTARKMYEEEFATIWQVQSGFYPDLLSEELRRDVSHLLFFQRPIAAQSHLVGKCDLEPDQKRAAWATLEAQRFRILQKVNDLKVIYPGNPIAQSLTTEQRHLVFELLDRQGDQTFKALRKSLKLGPSEFNLENGGETRLRGNRTNVAMLSAFGERWDSLPAETQKQIVEEWRTSESEEALFRRGVRFWGLDEGSARQWVNTKPEDGYCSLSRRAIERLTPLMRSGKAFKEADNAVYGNRFSGGPVLDSLPPLHVHRNIKGTAQTERVLQQLRLGAIRNPAVERALTELRKVVNAIVREHGKPFEIRIELARELKKPRKERQSVAKKNRTRQKGRDAVKAALLKECGIQNPSRADIEKALLHEECGGICPYTGLAIKLADLFGAHPQFDVEHIIPLSRYPDDSFQNKTLCWHEENRNVKRNKTPFEAYSTDAERWEEIQIRVGAWKPGKLKRFLLRSEDELQDFTARQMNDTRYASVLASRLLESLYGGRDVQTSIGTRQVIFASSGAVTASLRRFWQLEGILRETAPSSNGRSKGKPRTDHRHHAIDALVTALTKPAVIQAMSRSASVDPAFWPDARAFRRVPAPWASFVESVRPHIERMIVSHRPEHKVSGALHKETNYGRPYRYGGKSVVNVRRPLDTLSTDQVNNIVDAAVRKAVLEKLAENGGNTEVFAADKPETLPVLTNGNGNSTLIKRVRVRESAAPESLRELLGNRFVEPNSIHHVALFVVRENGTERWEGVCVDIMEAYQRRRNGQPVVRRTMDTDSEAEACFLFSLMKGDTVEMNYDGGRRVFRVKKFYSAGSIWFTEANNAQSDKEQKKQKTTWSRNANSLRRVNARKVVVDLLGRVHPAND